MSASCRGSEIVLSARRMLLWLRRLGLKWVLRRSTAKRALMVARRALRWKSRAMPLLIRRARAVVSLASLMRRRKLARLVESRDLRRDCYAEGEDERILKGEFRVLVI
jgi:hypothetical protein